MPKLIKLAKKLQDRINQKTSLKAGNRTYKTTWEKNKEYLTELKRNLDHEFSDYITDDVLDAAFENGMDEEYFVKDDKRRSKVLGSESKLALSLSKRELQYSLASRKFEAHVWRELGPLFISMFIEATESYAVTIKAKPLSKKTYLNENPSELMDELFGLLNEAADGYAVLYRDEELRYINNKKTRRLRAIPHYQGLVCGDIASVLQEEKNKKQSSFKIWIEPIEVENEIELAGYERYFLKSVTYQTIGRSFYQPKQEGKKVPLNKPDEAFILKERSKRFLKDYIMVFFAAGEEEKAVTTSDLKKPKGRKSKDSKTANKQVSKSNSSKPDKKMALSSNIISDFHLSSSIQKTCQNLSQTIPKKNFYELEGSFNGKKISLAKGLFRNEDGVLKVDTIPLLFLTDNKQTFLVTIDLNKSKTGEIERVLRDIGAPILDPYKSRSIARQIDQIPAIFELNEIERPGLNSCSKDEANHYSYVFPNGDMVISSRAEDSFYSILKSKTDEPTVSVRGDQAKYFSTIFPIIKNHETAMLLAGVSLLPLLQQIEGLVWNKKGFVFALFGELGVGKTVLSELIGNSVWRSPESNFTWDATDNFLKANTSVFDGVLTLVDDITKHSDHNDEQRKAVNSLGMNIDQGIPRGRLGDQSNQPSKKFSTIFMTSANLNFGDTTFLEDEAERARSRRLMFVPSEQLKLNAAQIAEVYNTIKLNHGFLGPMVAQAICIEAAANYDGLTSELNRYIEKFLGLLAKKFDYRGDNIVEEQSMRFAAIYAILMFARKSDLFPKDQTGSIGAALLKCFTSLLGAMGHKSAGCEIHTEETFGDKLLKSALKNNIRISDVRNANRTKMTDDDFQSRLFLTHARDENCDILAIPKKKMIAKLASPFTANLKTLKLQGELIVEKTNLKRRVRVRSKIYDWLQFDGENKTYRWEARSNDERSDQDRCYCFRLSYNTIIDS